MKKLMFLMLLWAGIAAAQNTPTIGVLPDSGPNLPATCVVGQIYFKTTTTVGLNQCLTANTWTAVGGGGGSGTVSANSGSAGANAYYPSAGGSTTVSPNTGLTLDAVGNSTLAQGSISSSTPFMTHTVTWNAGGVAFTNWLSTITCTAAATASIAFGVGVSGTDLQVKYGGANCATPQLVVGAGTSSITAISLSSLAGNSGPYWANSAGSWVWEGGANTDTFGINASSGRRFVGVSNALMGFSSSSTSLNSANMSMDTNASRNAAGVWAFGDSTSANSNARLKAAGYMSGGTTFTGNNGCTESSLTGGATAGKFSVASTSCTIVITMGNSATAPNGWDCHAIDLTTLADVTNPHQTATTTTTVTIVTGTVVSGDVIQFSCIGY